MSNILGTIQTLEITAVTGVALVGVGVAGFFIWKYKHYLEDPLKGTDDISWKFTDTLEPANQAINKGTGGLLNFDYRTFGKGNNAQDMYETAEEMKKIKGLKTAVTVASVLNPMAAVGAAVVTGTKQTIDMGRDKGLIASIESGNNEALKKLIVDTSEAITKHDTEALEKLKVEDPTPYVTPEQMEKIKAEVDGFVSKHKFLKPRAMNPRREKLKAALYLQKQFKFLINEGVFLKNSIDHEASQLNQRTFTRAVAKNVSPHALITITRKRRFIVKDFLDKHGMSSTYN